MSDGENIKPGRPFTSTDENHVERVCDVIHRNRHLTVREVTNKVGISIENCAQEET